MKKLRKIFENYLKKNVGATIKDLPEKDFSLRIPIKEGKATLYTEFTERGIKGREGKIKIVRFKCDEIKRIRSWIEQDIIDKEEIQDIVDFIEKSYNLDPYENVREKVTLGSGKRTGKRGRPPGSLKKERIPTDPKILKIDPYNGTNDSIPRLIGRIRTAEEVEEHEERVKKATDLNKYKCVLNEKEIEIFKNALGKKHKEVEIDQGGSVYINGIVISFGGKNCKLYGRDGIIVPTKKLEDLFKLITTLQ